MLQRSPRRSPPAISLSLVPVEQPHELRSTGARARACPPEPGLISQESSIASCSLPLAGSRPRFNRGLSLVLVCWTLRRQRPHQSRSFLSVPSMKAPPPLFFLFSLRIWRPQSFFCWTEATRDGWREKKWCGHELMDWDFGSISTITDWALRLMRWFIWHVAHS